MYLNRAVLIEWGRSQFVGRKTQNQDCPTGVDSDGENKQAELGRPRVHSEVLPCIGSVPGNPVANAH